MPTNQFIPIFKQFCIEKHCRRPLAILAIALVMLIGIIFALSFFGNYKYLSKFNTHNAQIRTFDSSNVAIEGNRQNFSVQFHLLQQSRDLSKSPATNLKINILQQKTPNSQNNYQIKPIPKTIWLYLQHFDQQQKVQYQKYIFNLWYIKKSSNFDIIILNPQNIHKFLQESQILTIQKFKQNFKQIRLNKEYSTRQLKAIQLQYEYATYCYIRLCILQRYGGIFVHHNIIPTQSLSWFKNIQKMSSDQIYNKWGQQPQVLMVDIRKMQQYYTEEQLNKQRDNNQNIESKKHKSKRNQLFMFRNFHKKQIKEVWNLNYEVYFIASVRNARLIKEWKIQLQKMLVVNKGNLKTPHECQGLYSTNKKWMSTILSDSLKCILHRRQHKLDQESYFLQKDLDSISSARYYKLWSMSSQSIIDEADFIQKLQNSQNFTIKNQDKFGQQIRKHRFIRLDRIKQYNEHFLDKLRDIMIIEQQESRLSEEFQTSPMRIKAYLEDLQKDIHYENQFQEQIQRKYQKKQKNKFIIPKILWIYSIPNKTLTHINKMNKKTIQKYAKQNKYQIVQIDKQNYKQYMSEQLGDKISKLQLQLSSRMFLGQNQQINHQFESIIKRLIVYAVLYEKGGLYIDESMTVYEDLDWMENVMKERLSYVNYGNLTQMKQNKQLLAFYNPHYSSVKKYEPNIQRHIQFQKKIRLYPSIEDYFLAAKQKSQILQKILNTYIDILLNGKKLRIQYLMEKSQNLIGMTNYQSHYEEGHRIAAHMVLQQKQRELHLQNNNKNGPTQENNKKFAIDQFGLMTINCYLGPLKQHQTFHTLDPSHAFNYLSQLSLTQLSYQIGQLKFIGQIFNPQYVQQQIKFQHLSKKYNENSLISQFYLKGSQNQNADNFYKQSEVESTTLRPNSKEWEKLQKNVFIVQADDKRMFNKSDLITQLSVESVRRNLQKSDYKLHILSSSNLQEYIENSLFQRISKAISRSNYILSDEQISQIWGISLILSNGGIYLDQSTIMTAQNFNWLRYIARLPNNMIWNRYGVQNPQLVLLFNGMQAQLFNNLKYSGKYNTKSSMYLQYQQGFLAGIKGGKFLKQWLDVILEWLVLPLYDIQFKMKQYGMYLKNQNNEIEQKAIDFFDRSIIKKSAQYMLLKKDKQLHTKNRQLSKQKQRQYENSLDYYGIWSLSNHVVGNGKFTYQTNYDGLDYRIGEQQQQLNHIYRYGYDFSHVEDVLGRVKFLYRFSEEDKNVMNIWLTNRFKQNKDVKQLVHPGSFLQKYLNINQNKQLVEIYAKLTSIRLKYKAINKICY